MTGLTHRSGAILGTLAAAELMIRFNTNFEPVRDTILLVAGGTLCGYLPDIDTPYSHLGRKFILILWPLYLLQFLIKLFALIPGPFKKTLTKTGRDIGHRGIAHTPAFWAVVAIAVKYPLSTAIASMLMTYFTTSMLNKLFASPAAILGIGCLIGIATHLFLDAITEGIMIFYPIYQKRVHLTPLESGGIVDRISGIVFFMLSIYLVNRMFSLW